MTAIEYWPNFVDRDDEPSRAEVETLNQLLRVPFVERWSYHNGFSGYEITSDADKGYPWRQATKLCVKSCYENGDKHIVAHVEI